MRKKFVYQTLSLIAFIILYFVMPIYSEHNSKELFIKSIKLLIKFKGIEQLSNGDYITLTLGWNHMRDELIRQGYETKIIFYDATYWDDTTTYHLRGTKLNRYIVLWSKKPEENS
ncbi:MAG: hypothetical protein BEN18_08590 [Epulopiscium sp. Nuni2H_MBin001]|nr:MAG: hypothetical protein BEN18_08590 [Epulopiscium sp. Nuni2H_MBin001]